MSVEKLIAGLKKDFKTSENVLKKVEVLVNELDTFLKKDGLKIEVMLGGSVAKGTYIKDEYDADIFVRFDYTYHDKDISKILKNSLKKMGVSFVEVHGSRNYFQIKNEFVIEIVPVIKVSDYKKALNVSDMSPLHVTYFLRKTKNNKNIKNEIRLTKLFMKSARIYGAESYIKGFSGHVVDLLIIKYGSFLNLVKNASKWKPKVIIDLEKYHKDALMSLNSSKIESPLIIVDPVQKDRNAAAALSLSSFNIFINSCKNFLKKPSIEFFKKKEFSEVVDKIMKKNKGENFYSFDIIPMKGKDDVSGSKILKIKEYTESILKENDFKILDSDWEFDEKTSKIFIVVDKKILSEIRVYQGPPIDMKTNVVDFKKSHKNVFSKNGRFFAKEKRKYRKSENLFEDLIKEAYVKERCRKITFQKVI